VGGVALSQAFGDNTDIGISQKTLTKALGKFYDELEDITGKHYKDCTITIEPTAIFTEESAFVTVTADSTEAVCNFDSVRVYVDNVLVDEAIDMEVYTKNVPISQTCVVRVEGTILGKITIKEESILKTMPFFMGSGEVYTDVMKAECKKELHDGSLQGDYDISVENEGEYMFIIIPIAKKEEFRRAVFDMNGFEIPLTTTETTEYIICQTVNRYQAGTYNIDINING